MQLDEIIERLEKDDGSLASRWSASFEAEPMSGCWLWTGPAFESGERKTLRPIFTAGGKNYLAHRVSALIHFGRYDQSAMICHHCDNQMCVNPDHLYVGNHASNMADMARRGRTFARRHPERAKEVARRLGKANTHSKGSDNPKAKLTEATAAMIIDRAAAGVGTKDIAAEFGVDRTSVQRILRGKLWPMLSRPHGLPRPTGVYDRTGRTLRALSNQSGGER